jgi:hypothetical protein
MERRSLLHKYIKEEKFLMSHSRGWVLHRQWNQLSRNGLPSLSFGIDQEATAEQNEVMDI